MAPMSRKKTSWPGEMAQCVKMLDIETFVSKFDIWNPGKNSKMAASKIQGK